MEHIVIPAVKPILYGAVAGMLFFTVNFNDTGIASGVKKVTLQASAEKPLLLEFSAEVVTAFNAVSTNVLTVGNDTTANQYLAAADITEATPGFYPASNAKKSFRITANTDIYIKYTQTGTAATTGQAIIYINVTPIFPATNKI